MTKQILILPVALIIGRARQVLREQLAAPDFAYYVYVVDRLEDLHLAGVITLRELVLAGDEQPITSAMNGKLSTVDALESDAAAARQVADQHLVALLVTAHDGRLLGAITIDAAARLMPWPRLNGPRRRRLTSGSMAVAEMMASRSSSSVSWIFRSRTSVPTTSATACSRPGVVIILIARLRRSSGSHARSVAFNPPGGPLALCAASVRTRPTKGSVAAPGPGYAPARTLTCPVRLYWSAGSFHELRYSSVRGAGRRG
jgi:hypothetical protein